MRRRLFSTITRGRKNRQFCHCHFPLASQQLRHSLSSINSSSNLQCRKILFSKNENAFAGSSVPPSRPPSSSNKEVPTLALVPPTPEQLTTRSKSANILDFYATRPVKPSADATMSSHPSGSVSNFFASSPLLSKTKTWTG